MDLYYFWFKYQQSNKYSLLKEYKGERTKKQFELMLECKLIELKLMPKQQGKYNGQTKAEYKKLYKSKRHHH